MSENKSTEILTAEQGKIIDRTKLLLSAHATTKKQERMYVFVIGAALHQLKGVTPHGEFEKVKEVNFPAESRSTLGNAMTYCEAVQYFAKGKYPTVGYLGHGELFLTKEELSEKQKDKLADEIEQVSKGGGVMETIKAYKAKTTKKNPPKELTAEEQIEAQDAQTRASLDAGYQGALAVLDIKEGELLNMKKKEIELVLGTFVKASNHLRSSLKKQ